MVPPFAFAALSSSLPHEIFEADNEDLAQFLHIASEWIVRFLDVAPSELVDAAKYSWRPLEILGKLVWGYSRVFRYECTGSPKVHKFLSGA